MGQVLGEVIGMDIFTRFNRKGIDDRTIDTLIGLSKGIAADGQVNDAEARALLAWLVQSREATDNPVVVNLLDRIGTMLQDNALQPDEAAELLSLLQKIAGEPSEVGELAKSTSLPVDEPPPVITFPNKSFVFTGTCVYGTRKQCQEATASRGGVVAAGVTKAVSYLVLGTYVTDSWAHETYGRKIEKAMLYRDEGVPISIVTEEQWADAGHLG